MKQQSLTVDKVFAWASGHWRQACLQYSQDRKKFLIGEIQSGSFAVWG